MLSVMAIQLRNLCLVAMVIYGGVLSGCATTLRGANTDYTIRAAQPDVMVMLDLETVESRALVDWRARRDAANGKSPSPDFDYHDCQALPCTLNIPKARPFSVMAYKDGYRPQIYQIGQIHKNDLDRLTKAGAAASGAATAGSFGAAASTLGNLGAGAAPAFAGPVMIMAFPTTIFLLGSNEIDKSTKANYEFFPNPLEITLAPLGPDDMRLTKAEAVEAFSQQRITASLDPVKSDMCYFRSRRMGCWRAQKLQERVERQKRWDD